MKNKIILFLLISMILSISGIGIHSEGSNIEFRLIEYFRNGNLSGIEEIIKGGKVQKEFILLYEGQVAVLKKDYEGADKYFSEVMEYVKDKENRIYIVAEYLQEMMRLNEGFSWYKKKLINDYISHLETAKRKDVSYINRVKAYHISEELLYIEPANPVNKLLYARASLAVSYEKMAFNQISEILSKDPPENLDTFCETVIALADSYYYAHQRIVNDERKTRCQHGSCSISNSEREEKTGEILAHAKKILMAMLNTFVIPKKYKKIAVKKLKDYNDNFYNRKKVLRSFRKDAIRCAELVNKENEE